MTARAAWRALGATALAMAALAPAQPARAQQAAAPSQATRPPAPVRPEGVSGADAAAIKLLERSAAAYQGARPLRASFTQALVNPRTRTDLRSAGEFFQQGPTRFAFRFTQPAEDRIVSDGQALWLYSPSTAKGQVYKMPRAAGAALDLASSVLRDPERRYTVTALGDTTLEGRAVTVMRLVPKAQGAPFLRATLWIDRADALVRQAEFTEASGLVRTLAFTSVRTGVALPRGVFTFTPPAGVRVIDQAAALGGSARP